jgi:hypothetical protein
VQAYNEFLLSNNMQDFFTQMNELKNATGYGSLTWLIDAILLWQVDQIVQLDPVNFTFTYNPIDTSKCLVGYAAAQELFCGILVKVRGSQTDLLTTSQMASLTNYVNQVKISGQKILIQNLPSDKLGIYYTIYYNNQIEQTVVDGNVQQVITDFIQNLPFDGTLKISQLTAAILGVTGVQDAQFVSATGNGLGFTNSYNSAAGYMTIDGSYPLSSTLSYIQIQK